MKRKIILIIAFIATTIMSMYAQTPKREYLDVGDTISTYPKVEWIKGNAINNFDPSKIYIIDLWATWCKPCIAAMPHFNAMASKFKNRGVVFIAQDVMEDDRQKVLDFVKANDKMMGFDVAFGGGKGSDFEQEWIKPAGVSAIPETFVIKGNKLLWQTSPDMINEAVMEMLIKGDFSIEKAKKSVTN
ncbi:redoxin domain-containing protein [Pedobacter sp. KBS0701]|uniref:TlpA disulfide reductase family protein n=1 Tax=Pedobacter sp. KBS0701 TaxID=2578106 RepID=UPI00110F323A|nr:TlpA disulfide reductase family protein [Pedobacter sp. KBS0701]QDW24110.1 redoxin domain-containing protein [Pedobacter sp. KBS0701]